MGFNMFTFLSGAICSIAKISKKMGGAFNCTLNLGRVKEAVTSDIIVSLVTSEMFLDVMRSILVMLLVAVIATLGVAIIKNGQNELPKMKKSGDSFFKRVLRIFLIALIVPVMAISGIGVDGNVRKGAGVNVTPNFIATQINTDLYYCSMSFEEAINISKNQNRNVLFSADGDYVYKAYNELFYENLKEITLYINSEGKEVLYDKNGNYEVDDSSILRIKYGKLGEGPKKYERAVLESTMYKIVTGFGGNYINNENTIRGLFVSIPLRDYYIKVGDYDPFSYEFGTYFFVDTNYGDVDAYYYYFTKHLGLNIVSCNFDSARQNCDFEMYPNCENNYKPSRLDSCTYNYDTINSGLMGFINKTKGSDGELYGSVGDLVLKTGTAKGSYFTFGPKGLMAEGGFFENEKDSPSDCEFYYNDLTNSNSYFTPADYGNNYLASEDYGNKSLEYSYIRGAQYGGTNISYLTYHNWNTMKYALKFTNEMSTGGSAKKIRDPLTSEQIAEYYAQANSGSGQNNEYENGSGTNHTSASDEELNENIDKTAVATYKRFIGIVNTILPYEIGFILALALFYGLNVAIRYARADEPDEKKKVKQKLINIIVGAIIALVLTSIIILILNGDFIINILESMK